VLCTAPAGVGTHLPVAVKTQDFPEAETFGSKSVRTQHVSEFAWQPSQHFCVSALHARICALVCPCWWRQI